MPSASRQRQFLSRLEMALKDGGAAGGAGANAAIGGAAGKNSKKKGILKHSGNSKCDVGGDDVNGDGAAEGCGAVVLLGGSSEEVSTVRQTIAPQTSLSLKFDVSNSPPKINRTSGSEKASKNVKDALSCSPKNSCPSPSYLTWCVRAAAGGDVMFAVHRRPLAKRTVSADRVSKFTVTPSPTANNISAAAAHSNGVHIAVNNDADGDDVGGKKSSSSASTSFSAENPDAIDVAPSPPPPPAEQQTEDEQQVAEAKGQQSDNRHSSPTAGKGHQPANRASTKSASSVIAVFEEVEEDIGSSEDLESVTELVEKPRRICRGKEFSKGRVRCDRGFTYTVVMENPCTVFPSKTVEYCIKTVSKEGLDAMETTDSDADREEEETAAKLEDLMHFVSEIMNAEPSSKSAKSKAAKESGGGGGGSSNGAKLQDCSKQTDSKSKEPKSEKEGPQESRKKS